MDAIQVYPFNLAANASQIILAKGQNFRIQTTTGPVNVTIDNIGTIPGLQPSQGINGANFSRLVIQDASGAANSGTILISPFQFVDFRTYGSQTITGGSIDLTAATQAAMKNPLAPTGTYQSAGILTANTPDTVFLPASNINGAVVLSAEGTSFNASSKGNYSLISKASAPTTPTDGNIVCAGVGNPGENSSSIKLSIPQFIPAGLGLYFITNTTETAGLMRGCRYRLL